MPAAKIRSSIERTLGISPSGVRRLLRYDVEGLTERQMRDSVESVFSEPNTDRVFYDVRVGRDEKMLVVQFLDGQYDQRADSAMQCVQFLTGGVRPVVKCAEVYVFKGVTDAQFEKIKRFLVNPVDSREGTTEMPQTLKDAAKPVGKMRVELDGFTEMDEDGLKRFHAETGLAMTVDDLRFVRDYFVKKGRQPTLTELKVVDTYWSDHCRHTTFSTRLGEVKILSDNPEIHNAWEQYKKLFEKHNVNGDKVPCLMSIATIAAKELKSRGLLDNLDESDEINACSVVVDVDVDGKDEQWLILFKNETHNHPTEIEPFGGAATCLGGAIRDPLSGRTYVYQAMRVSGCGTPDEPVEKTLPGKLPQRVLTTTALAGFSGYGNQIGLATGIVAEIYNDRYKAKRLETGYVIGGNRRENVVRRKPRAGDAVIMVGGDTGRDGCGGATGSSKSHDVKSVETCGAEVQKGNPPEERKLQRLFRNPRASRLVLKCNDFGAGGVCVAIGELADGLHIYLDRINKKYEGLSATELAISESQERMAVVVSESDAEEFMRLASDENLKCVKVAEVTEEPRLVMTYGEETITDIDRAFLDTNGVRQSTDAEICESLRDYFSTDDDVTVKLLEKSAESALKERISRLDVCSRKGMGEVFDSTIGAASVLMPFGGKNQLTPAAVMASKPPVGSGYTSTITCSSFALYTDLMEKSPFTGAVYSVVGAVSKLVSCGVNPLTIRLTLQEFFKKPGNAPDRWGEPLSALLGALDAQLGLETAAIGGKDSMSGTFENLDVPPTLIAFGMGIAKENAFVHNAFERAGKVVRFRVPKNSWGRPDYAALKEIYGEVYEGILNGKILHTAVVEEGGAITALVKSLFANDLGAKLDRLEAEHFRPAYGDILAVVAEDFDSRRAEYFAELDESGVLVCGGEEIALDALKTAFCGRLEQVFPTTAPAYGQAEEENFVSKKFYVSRFKTAKPRVFIPVFPGTNCEYDMQKAFENAGAECDVFVVKNLSASDVEFSVAEMGKRLSAAQILAFPGGFSGGDEPDGSGKFIVNMFRNPSLRDAAEELLEKRDGLAIGICNGFQALIKLGLLPFGKIKALEENAPTLTFNNIGRHVSAISRVRVASNASAWLNRVKTGDVFSVPVSHGEGRFVCDPATLQRLRENGQIFTQYVDLDGKPTMQSPFNPNGSVNAVEGIISPDGRVLGKMGHAERIGKGLYRNVAGNWDMGLFRSGVEYFK